MVAEIIGGNVKPIGWASSADYWTEFPLGCGCQDVLGCRILRSGPAWLDNSCIGWEVQMGQCR